jgi:hypothetical protein
MPIIISTENYTVVQIKKNLDDYIAGKFVENAPKPNWDGTFEKAPQPKLSTTNGISKETKMSEEVNKKQLDNKKMLQGNDDPGLPPSPQSQDSPKKR